MPAGAVKVDRTTKWGNPFVVGQGESAGSGVCGEYVHVRTAEEAVVCFEELLKDKPELVERAKRELAGRDVACWCAEDAACHGDVLLRVSNE